MLRTLNFTGRKKIPREAARISLQREAGGVVFDAELDLAEFELPPQARVFIEAFFKTAYERFAWGTVSDLTPPDDRRLKRLAQPELANFRVKVVEPSASGAGRLLAVADYIAPEGLQGTGKQRMPLFRVNARDELADEIWRLDFDDSGPILDLNRGVAGIKECVREEAFMALVFPAVMREVFAKIFADACGDSDDDRDGWPARWLRFGVQLANRPLPPSTGDEPSNDRDEWVDEVVIAWSRRQKIVANFKRTFASAEGGAK